MRYFTSLVKLKEDERIADEDEYDVLYEELNRVGAAFIRTPTAWRRKEFVVDTILYDTNTTIEDVRSLIQRSLDIWDITEKVESFKCESLEKPCEGNGFFYKRIYDLIPTSEIFFFCARYKTSFSSYVFLPKTQEQCIEIVQGSPWKKSIGTEISRIFENSIDDQKNDNKVQIDGGNSQKNDDKVQVSDSKVCNETLACHPRICSHAFHYIINGVSNPKFKDCLSAVISARLQTGSLLSPNVFVFDIDNLSHDMVLRGGERTTFDLINESLAEALSGNTVVLKYGLHDQGGNYDNQAFKELNKFIDILVPHLDETLVVFAIPNLNPSLELSIARRFDYPLVPLNIGVSDAIGLPTKKEAESAFAELAAEDNLQVDDALFELFDKTIEQQNFVSCEATYTRWKVSKRISDEFPNYGFALEKFDDVKKQQSEDSHASLEALVGLKTVKAEINKVLAYARMEEVSCALGLKSPDKSLHLAFVGNPGTGKTEVARLYGKILNEAHILSEGRVISVGGSRLIDPYIVSTLFEVAKGSVLFIDEAYAIYDPGVISELIANMENMRDEVVVILAGYTRDMEKLFNKNPGFKSRIGSIINFPDYTAEELLEIFKFVCNKNSITVEDDALQLVNEVLSRQGRRLDQGNARYVRTLFEQILTEQRVRLDTKKTNMKDHKFTETELTTFTLTDVKASISAMKKDEEDNSDVMSARDELEQLIGLDDVKSYASEMVDFFKVQKDRKQRGLAAKSVSMHMAFTGAPGTGKTEVARLMGRILADEGILSVGGLIECGRSDLIGDHVGETAPKIEDLFERARGSIIFIDEAYSILDSDGRGYGREAIDTLIAQMENLRDEVVVIFAGYDEEIDNLFQANPGFASRVKTRIHFDDYSTPEMVEIFKLMAQKRSFILGRGFDKRLVEIFDNARKKRNFGNGRYVRNLLEETIRKQAKRIVLDMGKGSVSDKMMQTLKVEDIRIPDNIISKGSFRNVIGFTG